MGAQRIPVAELFAGVGGFRLGLGDDDFRVVWSNQWEPGEKAQWATGIYEERFGSEGHTGNSIHDFTHPKDGVADIPDHDLLVGGFPCQDYSVARTISGELGIKGEKGKLWVDIARIIRHKRPRPKVVLLENVPRLPNSPANARGLNFAIILDDFLKEGYHVEWRVINAADYGMPQQRSRVFILAYRTSGGGQNVQTNGSRHFGCRNPGNHRKMSTWILGEKGDSGWKPGPFARAFSCKGNLPENPQIVPPLDFQFNSRSSPFGNAGYAWKKKATIDGKRVVQNVFWSTKVKADYDGERQTLGDVLVDEHDPHYELDNENGLLDRYAYMKGEQKEWRIRKEDADKAREIEGDLWALYQKCTRGYRTDWWADSREDPRYLEGLEQGLIYQYTAGAMAYPDPLDKPSRTVVTAEIGKSVSRMRHVIEYEEGKFRGLMPLELERLNMFPDNWTEYEGISDSRRGFLMGNALVVGVVERLATHLAGLIRRREE